MAEKEKVAVKAKQPSAAKRNIQSKKRNQRNRQFKSRVKTAIRHLEESVKGGDANANVALNQVYSLMDKGVKKGIVPLNAARRTKSRLASRLTAKA